MTEPVSRRAKIARKLYITAWWLLGAGWLVVTVGSFVLLKPTPSETVKARPADDGEWEDITNGQRRPISAEEAKVLGLEHREPRGFSYAKTAGLDPGAADSAKQPQGGSWKALLKEHPELARTLGEPASPPVPPPPRIAPWIKHWVLASVLAALPWVLLVVGNRWLRWLLA